MKRLIFWGAAWASSGLVVAQEPPTSPSWTPPATVWRDATKPLPVLQPVPVPGVPSPTLPSTTPLKSPPMETPKATREIAPAPQPALQAAPHSGMATAPLPQVLSWPLPVTPTVPPMGMLGQSNQVGCGPESTDCGPVARGTCLARLRDWLCFQPGPSVLPPCQPNRYQVPVRYYFPCVGGAGCAPGVGGHSAPLGANLGSGLGANLGASRVGLMNGQLRGLITPAGRGGMAAGSSGGVLGPIAGGCGQPGLISDGPLAHLMQPNSSCNSDGCVAIKHKGLGACSEPSDAAPVTGPICLTTQAVGVPLPASCVGSPPDYTGCYASCTVAGNACRVGAGGHLLDRLFGTCHGGCSEVAQGGNGFVPTSIVPVVTGYTRSQVGNYRLADPISHIPTGNPQIGQPQIDGTGPQLLQSGYRADPTRPFTRQ